MAAQGRSLRRQAWSFLKRKQVLNFVLAMSLMTILSLVSAEEVETIQHISTLDVLQQGSTNLQQGITKWRSRRALLQDSMQERQAPRSYPPPQGNALVNNPRNAPPGRTFFDNHENRRPAARIPDNARRLVPPPHP